MRPWPAEEALAQGEALAGESPEDAYALNALGRVYGKLSRLSEAEECFTKAARIGGRAAANAMEELRALANAYRSLGEKEAAERLERILQTSFDPMRNSERVSSPSVSGPDRQHVAFTSSNET